MKAAILSDLHGNSTALMDVLRDIRSSGGVDEYWLLGDYAALGPDPAFALQLIHNLPRTRLIHGNTDRYLYTGELPGPSLKEVEKNPQLFRKYLELVRSFTWTAGAISAAKWLEWLKELPLEQRFTLPDGTRVVAVHAAPGTDDGDGIDPHTPEETLTGMVSGLNVDLLLVGHTHIPFDRTVGKVRIVNPGSISNPFPPDLRASYAVLEADEDGYQVVHRRVDYDRNSVIRELKKVDHPARKYIAGYLKGRHKKPWMEDAPSQPEES